MFINGSHGQSAERHPECLAPQRTIRMLLSREHRIKVISWNIFECLQKEKLSKNSKTINKFGK